MLNGRVVLVTGGGAGIGAAVSKAMAAAGARVVVPDIAGRAAGRTAEAARNGAIAASARRFGARPNVRGSWSTGPSRTSRDSWWTTTSS